MNSIELPAGYAVPLATTAPSTLTALPSKANAPGTDQTLLTQPEGKVAPVNSASTAGVRITAPPLPCVTGEHVPVPPAKSDKRLTPTDASIRKLAGLAGAVALPARAADVNR